MSSPRPGYVHQAALLGASIVFAAACTSIGAPPTPTMRAATTALQREPLTPAPDVAGDPAAGRILFVTAGCVGCHTLTGVPSATGVAGPNLTNVVLRPTLASAVVMTPENMTLWLLDPPSVKPGTSMPALGLTLEQARDLTAYLYSQPFNPRR